jgi:hypothetical protein
MQLSTLGANFLVLSLGSSDLTHDYGQNRLTTLVQCCHINHVTDCSRFDSQSCLVSIAYQQSRTNKSEDAALQDLLRKLEGHFITGALSGVWMAWICAKATYRVPDHNDIDDVLRLFIIITTASTTTTTARTPITTTTTTTTTTRMNKQQKRVCFISGRRVPWWCKESHRRRDHPSFRMAFTFAEFIVSTNSAVGSIIQISLKARFLFGEIRNSWRSLPRLPPERLLAVKR